MLNDQINSHTVLATSWNNDVRMHHGWLDVVVEHGLDKLIVLFEHTLQIATTFRDVALKTTSQANVRIGFNENFHVHHVHKFSVGKNKDPFAYDHIRTVHGFLEIEHFD